MRDLNTIDDELRLLGLVRRAIADLGGQSSTVVVDRLLEERHTAVVEGDK